MNRGWIRAGVLVAGLGLLHAALLGCRGEEAARVPLGGPAREEAGAGVVAVLAAHAAAGEAARARRGALYAEDALRMPALAPALAGRAAIAAGEAAAGRRQDSAAVIDRVLRRGEAALAESRLWVAGARSDGTLYREGRRVVTLMRAEPPGGGAAAADGGAGAQARADPSPGSGHAQGGPGFVILREIDVHARDADPRLWPGGGMDAGAGRPEPEPGAGASGASGGFGASGASEAGLASGAGGAGPSPEPASRGDLPLASGGPPQADHGVEARLAGLARALGRADEAALGALFHDEARLFLPNAEPVAGRAAVAAALLAGFEGPPETALLLDDLTPAGGFLAASGRLWLEGYGGDGTEALRRATRFLAVFLAPAGGTAEEALIISMLFQVTPDADPADPDGSGAFSPEGAPPGMARPPTIR